MEKGLTRGAVARRAGVNAETLRFYEKQGVIAIPPRLESGYRSYPEETVDIVIFIKRAQELGFTLREIQGLLSLSHAEAGQCEAVQQVARQKLQAIRSKIESLRAMEQALESLLIACKNPRRDLPCPILESLVAKQG